MLRNNPETKERFEKVSHSLARLQSFMTDYDRFGSFWRSLDPFVAEQTIHGTINCISVLFDEFARPAGFRKPRHTAHSHQVWPEVRQTARYPSTSSSGKCCERITLQNSSPHVRSGTGFFLFPDVSRFQETLHITTSNIVAKSVMKGSQIQSTSVTERTTDRTYTSLSTEDLDCGTLSRTMEPESGCMAC